MMQHEPARPAAEGTSWPLVTAFRVIVYKLEYCI